MYELLINSQDPFHNDYNLWRVNRVRKMESILGRNWFKSKRILELGCGTGNISAYLQSIGADVTAADVRQAHLDRVKQTYGINTMLINQELEWTVDQRFDLVIHFGVLYHLKNWRSDLRCALVCADMMFLETVVANTTDPMFEHYIEEDSTDSQSGFGGFASVMSAENIQQEIERNGYEWMRFDDADLSMPNRRLYQYDWEVTHAIAGYETAQTFEDAPLYGGRRFWLIKKSFANDQLGHTSLGEHA